MITTPAQKVYFNPLHYFTVVEKLDRFDVDVVEKPFFVPLRELSSFIRNHLHEFCEVCILYNLANLHILILQS